MQPKNSPRGFFHLAAQLFDALYNMDAEATTITPSGYTTGLSDYGRHARSDLAKPQCEVEWSNRLAVLLSQRSYPTEREQPYPDSPRKKCDLVVRLPQEERCWIEVKGAWRDYWGGKNTTYRSYLLHPLVLGLDESKTHTVPLDLEKLRALRPTEAHHVGMLLVGFEDPNDSMDEDIAELTKLAQLGPPWALVYGDWMSPNHEGQRVRCWFWHRPTVLAQ